MRKYHQPENRIKIFGYFDDVIVTKYNFLQLFTNFGIYSLWKMFDICKIFSISAPKITL